jgi:hypothetical protein
MGRDSTFVDQHIQATQDMFARSQEELHKLVVGGNITTSVEETKEAVMGDETEHLKRSLSSDSDSSDSDLSTAMMNNV